MAREHQSWSIACNGRRRAYRSSEGATPGWTRGSVREGRTRSRSRGLNIAYERVGHDTSHIPGTGLGLYLSRELARLQGGDLDVESELGKGTRTRLTLPLWAAPISSIEP